MFAAASRVEKVRINRVISLIRAVYSKIDYTDEEYSAEIEKIEEELVPLLDICRTFHRLAHRCQPRITFRPHHEPLAIRRRNGGKCS